MTEPFPQLNGGAPSRNLTPIGIPRRKRKSSALGGDLPGDVDVPALATHRPSTPPMHSPISMDSVCVP